MRETYDLAIVGSGFAGSLLAMIARRMGLSVVMVERGKHPRIVIGESSTPLTNLLLEELTTRYDLPVIRSLSKWGSWQQEHPEIACGLKRGFTFFHHDLKDPKPFPPSREEQLLVAASPHDAIADTHWYRADFDHLFVREAERMGVVYYDETDLTCDQSLENRIEFTGDRQGSRVNFSAAFLVDATGPRGFLHRALKLGECELPGFPRTQALFSHFTGVRRLDDFVADTFYVPPYPVDDAAVHHMFEGGWIWVLRFNNGVTSAGISATDELADELGFREGAGAWDRILKRIPILQNCFQDTKAIQPFTHIPRLSFRSSSIAGRNHAMLPSAAGFVDPLMSTGFPLTLLGIARIAEVLEARRDSRDYETRLQKYATRTDADLVATSKLIAGLYANLNNFPVFTSLSLLYFAAASFSETARRLGKPQLASSFLLYDHPTFGPDCAALLERAQNIRTSQESVSLSEDVLRTIESINLAGLGRKDRRNWFPVEASDLLDSHLKVEASRDEIFQLLQRCGFAPGLTHT
jgi:tetracycline 7-halogenase / FADH2 O2-dependent halogenase